MELQLGKMKLKDVIYVMSQYLHVMCISVIYQLDEESIVHWMLGNRNDLLKSL